MPGYLGVFIDSLAPLCESIICYMYTSVATEESDLGYMIKSKNVTLIEIDRYTSTFGRTVRSLFIKKSIMDSFATLNVLLIRCPTLLMHKFVKIPTSTALLVVGDYPDKYNLSQLKLVSRFINRWYYQWMSYYQLKITRNSIVLAASEMLYKKLQPIADKIVNVKTTTLSAKDIYIRSDTCQDEVINLLFVGRYDRSKGLFELYKSVALLKDKGKNYKLSLVGWPNKSDPILDELDEYAEKLGIKTMITNLGYKKLGTELFDVYKRADIYVMPTKFDEFGRTIWEAMAHSLPVVSTKVGSIPVQLTNGLNAILVEPGDSEAFADAINNVANDKQLRQKLIKEGRELASQNTLEIQSKKMIDELEKYIIKNDE